MVRIPGFYAGVLGGVKKFGTRSYSQMFRRECVALNFHYGRYTC